MEYTEEIDIDEEVARICDNMSEENKEVERYRPAPPLPFLGQDDKENIYDYEEAASICENMQVDGAVVERNRPPTPMPLLDEDGRVYVYDLPESLPVARRSPQPYWHKASQKMRLYRGQRASHSYGLGGIGSHRNQQHDDYDGSSTSRAVAEPRTLIRPTPRRTTMEDIISALRNHKVVAEKGASNAKIAGHPMAHTQCDLTAVGAVTLAQSDTEDPPVPPPVPRVPWRRAPRRMRLYRGLRASHSYGLGGVGFNHNQQHDDYDGPSTSRAVAVRRTPIPRRTSVEDIISALRFCKLAPEKEASNEK